MPEKINNITQNEFDSLKNMLLSEGMGDVELAYGIINDRYYKNKYDVLIHRLIYIFYNYTKTEYVAIITAQKLQNAQ